MEKYWDSPGAFMQEAEHLVGCSNQILRSLLMTGDRAAVFDFCGRTLEQVAVSLDCCELAELRAWDAQALLEAATIAGCEERRVGWGELPNAKLARRIALAMKAEEAPDTMRPADGVLFLHRAGIDVYHELSNAVAVMTLMGDVAGDIDAPASKGEAVTVVPRRQRQDALAVELDAILVAMKTRTPAKVMAELRKKIGTPHTCILRNVGDGIEWENNRGTVKTLTITLLGERIIEWKKTDLSQG